MPSNSILFHFTHLMTNDFDHEIFRGHGPARVWMLLKRELQSSLFCQKDNYVYLVDAMIIQFNGLCSDG